MTEVYLYDLGTILVSSGAALTITGRGVFDGWKIYAVSTRGGLDCRTFYEDHIKQLIASKKIVLVKGYQHCPC